MITFIGVDLAWRDESAQSGVAVLRGDERGADLITTVSGITSARVAAELVQSHASEDTVVAVDAPLIIRNATGQRPCETEVGRRFARHHATCHTTNLSLYPDAASLDFARRLARVGFAQDFDAQRARRRPGRWMMEVYPHPAMVVLFGLRRIIRYKKGHLAGRLEGLHELRTHLRSLRLATPALRNSPALHDLLSRDTEELRGGDLKRYEDTLDALFCAYLALHCWNWGEAGNEMIGDLESGYIVVPTRRAALETPAQGSCDAVA